MVIVLQLVDFYGILECVICQLLSWRCVQMATNYFCLGLRHATLFKKDVFRLYFGAENVNKKYRRIFQMTKKGGFQL